MKGSAIAYLGVRHLKKHKFKTALLIASLALVLFLPFALRLSLQFLELQLQGRAASTPLLVGAAGSELELAFSGLYFSSPELPLTRFGAIDQTRRSSSATIIPALSCFQAQGHPIVGTTLRYLEQRSISLKDGRPFAFLGECLLGSDVAADTGLTVGDSLFSSPETLFDLTGVYPLKLEVVGVLEKTGEADDRAVFTDLKTTWIIAGLGHGHAEASRIDNSKRLQDSGTTETDTIRLNASLREFQEITPETAASFHFHGNESDYPVSTFLIFPGDARERALLRAEFAKDASLQAIVPTEVMDAFFATVFRLEKFFFFALLFITFIMLMLALLIFRLSLQLRRNEFANLSLMGVSKSDRLGLALFEGLAVLLCAALVAALALVALQFALPVAFRSLL